MIKLTVREAAESRGIKNPADLAKAMGHNSRTIAGRLWKGQEVRLQALDQAAEALDCDLGELIKRVPDKKAQKSSARQGEPKKLRK